MTKASPALESLPSASAAALRKLGGDLTMARKRRCESLKQWAVRLNVSVPTLIRLERGDPSVSMGIYATALWVINRHGVLAQAADPREDLAALEMEVQRANQRHRPRSERG